MGGADDDFDFEAEMVAEGARPLDGRRSGRRGPHQTRAGATPERSKRRPAAAPAARPALDPRAATGLAAVRAELDATRAELAAARGELDAAQEGLAAARSELEATRATLAATEDERGRLDRERRALSRKVSELGAQAEAAPRFEGLGAHLGRAGVETDEAAEVLAGLTGLPGAAELIELLGTEAPGALAAWIDAHLALTCGAAPCAPAAGAFALPVAPARCDICGGSDIKRAARRFFGACADAGVRRVRVVGGSPTYGRLLRELAEGQPVALKLISGTARRTLKEARADQKHADLVILWGATLLDHATSELYDKGRSRVITVAHRGISRMLELVSEGLGRSVRGSE